MIINLNCTIIVFTRLYIIFFYLKKKINLLLTRICIFPFGVKSKSPPLYYLDSFFILHKWNCSNVGHIYASKKTSWSYIGTNQLPPRVDTNRWSGGAFQSFYLSTNNQPPRLVWQRWATLFVPFIKPKLEEKQNWIYKKQ